MAFSDTSHPTRVRGLKHIHRDGFYHLIVVAPHAGAWIETVKTTLGTLKSVVAPHAGAWIETYHLREDWWGW